LSIYSCATFAEFWNLAVAVGVDVSGHAAVIGTQHPVGHPVAVDIE
jgi:hypothetical protein